MPVLPELTKLDPNTRITGTDRQKLGAKVAKHYKAGTSCREISEMLGRSYGFVHSLLEDQGIAMRARGGPQTKGTGAAKANEPSNAQKLAAAKGKAKALGAGAPVVTPEPVSVPETKKAARQQPAAARKAKENPTKLTEKIDAPDFSDAVAKVGTAAKKAAARLSKAAKSA